MVASTSREVVFVLTTQVDPSAASGFEEMAKRAKQTQAAIQQVAKQTVAAETKISQERVRVFEREQADIGRAQKQALAADERDRKEALRAYAAAGRERQRIAKQTAQAEAREATQAARAKAAATKQQTQLEREADRAAATFQQKLTALAVGRRNIVSGSLHLARGMALLFTSNEKQAEKLIQNLMKIQGAYDLLKGARQIIHGISGVYAAYTAAVTAATMAQQANAAATTKAAAAHMANATATRLDAAANQQLAASAGQSAVSQGMSRIGAMGRLLGQGLSRGAGLLRLAAPVAGPVGAVAATAAATVGIGVHFGAHGARRQARMSGQRLADMQSAVTERRRIEAEVGPYQERIADVERQRRLARTGMQQAAFDREVAYDEQAREARGRKVGDVMEGWSATPGIGRKVPGQAEFREARSAIRDDWSAGRSAIDKQANKARLAAENVAAAQQAQQAAEARAEEFRGRSPAVQFQAAAAESAVEENKVKWATGFNWIHRAGSGIGAWARGRGALSEQERLEGVAANARARATDVSTVGSQAQVTQSAAQQATVDALEEQKRSLEELDRVKQVQAQRDIQNTEEYITKLKELHTAHLANADAIEKGGRALSVQLALMRPTERGQLTRAMQRAQAGTATDKELALLASHASPERREYFEKKIEARHPEYAALREYEGLGQSAVQAAKDKAAEVEAEQKRAEKYVAGAKEAALAASQNMSDRLAQVLGDLFKAQEKSFISELEKLRTEFANRNRGENQFGK